MLISTVIAAVALAIIVWVVLPAFLDRRPASELPPSADWSVDQLEAEVLRLEGELKAHESTLDEIKAYERNKEALEGMIEVINTTMKLDVSRGTPHALALLSARSDLSIRELRVDGSHLELSGELSGIDDSAAIESIDATLEDAQWIRASDSNAAPTETGIVIRYTRKAAPR